MPVILDPETHNLWLDPGMKDVSAASELLKPYEARLMRCFPASMRINHAANVGLQWIAHDGFSIANPL